MVHFPSEGVDRLVKEYAVPEAKYSCSTYPWAARSVGVADSGSSTVPASGGGENDAGACHGAPATDGWPDGAVFGALVAADPHAARMPVSSTRATARCVGPVRRW